MGQLPLLSHGAIEALKQHGEAWQHDAFLKPLIEGRWTGTMCLTEPHCGTDLGLLKTKAEPNADGSYAITGTKIFITAGEHDLTDNIVHLVLGCLTPLRAKGISLFVTPSSGSTAKATSASATHCAAVRSNTRWASRGRSPA